MKRIALRIGWVLVALASPAVLAQAEKGASGTPLAGPRIEPGGYRLERGPYNVDVVDDLVLTDEARNKDLHVKVRAPVPKGKDGAEEKFPLLVFSHGLGGSKDAFPDLLTHLAEWGYVVVSPSHADSIALRRAQGERPMREDYSDLRLMTPEAREGRVNDIKFIVGAADVLEAKVPALKTASGKGRINREKVAVGGHSAGAYTTQLIAGMKVRSLKNAQGETFGDPRVKAVVVISGQGVNGAGIKADAWEKIAIPMLVITGSRDTTSIGNETPKSRRDPFEHSRGTEKGGPPAYLLWIEGATHGSYAGKATANQLGEKPDDVDMITRCTGSAVQAFLDRYVRGEQAGETYLKGEGIKTLGGGKATLEKKSQSGRVPSWVAGKGHSTSSRSEARRYAARAALPIEARYASTASRMRPRVPEGALAGSAA